MTPSNRLLIRLVNMRIAIAASAAFLLMFFFSIIESPRDPKYLPLVLIVGFGLTLLLRLNSLFLTSMFPISNNQVAWIPMGIAALASLAGAAGLFSGQMWGLAFNVSYGLSDILSYWVTTLHAWPVALFFLLLITRGLKLNPGFAGFLGFLPALILSPGKHPGFDSPVILFLLSVWPLWAAGCAFLIWEAPRQTGMLRRVDYLEAGFSWFRSRTPQLAVPTRPAFANSVADAMLWLALLTGLGYYFHIVIRISYEDILLNPFHLLYLLFLAIPIQLALACWRRNRASGMSDTRAKVVMLLEMTGVGYAFRDRLGVVNGTLVRCTFCSNWRMPWQRACPHCNDQGLIAETNKRPKMWALIPQNDPLAMIFRVMLPLYLLGAFIVSSWRH